MHKKLIVGLSGRKQSGKDTVANYVVNHFPERQSSVAQPSVKLYSFAHLLKKNLCMDILGLSWEQCNGTDEQKNTKTNYKWSDFPLDMRKNHTRTEMVRGTERKIYLSGHMTARQVMQFVGTDMFREYFGENIWVEATLKQIQKDDTSICIVTDARFPSEVNSIIYNDGIVIRLNRNIFPEDSHASETSLDSYDFVSTKNCHLVENRNMKISEQNKLCFNIIKDSYYKEE
jgi:hypothetical protein